MDYVINPMWFYWIQVVQALRIVLILLAISGSVASIIYWIMAADEKTCCGVQNNREYRIYKKNATIFSIVSSVLILGVIFIPSKNTLIEMQIARYATKQNVEFGIEAIKSATDYVIEAIKQIK